MLDSTTARQIETIIKRCMRFSLEANGFFKTKYKSKMVEDYKNSDM